MATNLYELLDEMELKHFDTWTLSVIRTEEEYKTFRSFVIELPDDNKDYWMNLGWAQMYEHFLKQFQH